MEFGGGRDWRIGGLEDFWEGEIKTFILGLEYVEGRLWINSIEAGFKYI